jgi:hypothetical protein
MSVDIVNLIESNPITKFNGNYQSKLIEKVKNNFTEYEQQIFLASFYCYLKYDSKNDFVIDLDNVWQWLGFGQKVNAKRVLEKNFLVNTDYKLLLCQPAKQTTNTKGGHNKETFMLNIKTFKLFCIKAETKKADEIHEYFVKLEEILQEVLIEESDELKNQLSQLENTKNKEMEEKLSKQRIIDREKILLKEYAQSGPLVYIIKVKTYENGHYVIKIGESRKGISDRYREHKSKYGECLLLDCFSVQNSKDFESFIHNNENIRGNKVHNLQGHETELELFLIGKNLTYKILLNIINNNIKYFNDNNSKLLLENEQLKLMIEMKNSNNENMLVQQLIQTVKQLSDKIDNLEKTNQEVLKKLLSKETKVTTGFNQPFATLGPRLQKINPETLELIKVYESVSELMKEDTDIKRPSINKAVIENTVYCGYRWLQIDRELDPNVIHNILPTKQTNVQNVGYIAQLNKEKTEIVNVFLDRKTACHFNGYQSGSALDIPVKNFTLSKDFYYKLYDECNSDLKKTFINKNNGAPLLYKNGIAQCDSANNVIREFACKYDCIKQLMMSDKTLAKALDKNVMYKNCYFKTIGNKLKCF